jgi:hypothetical protein
MSYNPDDEIRTGAKAILAWGFAIILLLVGGSWVMFYFDPFSFNAAKKVMVGLHAEYCDAPSDIDRAQIRTKLRAAKEGDERAFSQLSQETQNKINSILGDTVNEETCS